MSLCSLWFPFSASVLHFQGPPGYTGPSWITQDGLCVSQLADHRLGSIYNLCHETQSVYSFQEAGCWHPWGHVVLPNTGYLANVSANLMCFSWYLDDKVSHTPFSPEHLWLKGDTTGERKAKHGLLWLAMAMHTFLQIEHHTFYPSVVGTGSAQPSPPYPATLWRSGWWPCAIFLCMSLLPLASSPPPSPNPWALIPKPEQELSPLLLSSWRLENFHLKPRF